MNVFVSSLIGEHYVTHSFSQSGDVQWFTIAALNDNTQVTVQRPGAEIQRGTVNALQSIRYIAVCMLH